MARETIWDISPAIRPGMPVWPGDTPYSEARTWQLDASCPVNVSKFTMSTHSGAHADAPFHYDPEGRRAGELDLAPYIGACRLVDATGAGGRIEAADLGAGLDAGVERLLIRTHGRAPEQAWDSDFKAVAAEAIDRLGRNGVRLIGVDTPSLDPEDSKTLDAHMAVRRHSMAILEGLVLDRVPEGDYELIALPLKLAGLDAAPVRAVLRPLGAGRPSP